MNCVVWIFIFSLLSHCCLVVKDLYVSQAAAAQCYSATVPQAQQKEYMLLVSLSLYKFTQVCSGVKANPLCSWGPL